MSKDREMTIKRRSHFEENKWGTYGFTVVRKDNTSIPKGTISSVFANIVMSGVGDYEILVEFSIQSPTGDSSDFHHWSMGAMTWNQAKKIVDDWYEMTSAYVMNTNQKEENRREWEKRLYS